MFSIALPLGGGPSACRGVHCLARMDEVVLLPRGEGLRLMRAPANVIATPLPHRLQWKEHDKEIKFPFCCLISINRKKN